MPMRFQQLLSSLEKGLRSVYLFSGNEPWQIFEAMRLVRGKARQQGFDERVVLEADATFDWSRLIGEVTGTSLFSSRRLLELTLDSPSPGRDGEAAMIKSLEALTPETLLLVRAPRLDKRQSNRSWVRAIDQQGAWVAVWPLSREETRFWLRHQCRQRQLTLTEEAVDLLLEKIEGNLPAAIQIIEQFAMIHDEGVIRATDIMEGVSDQTRFEPGQIMDAVYSGDFNKVRIVLANLRNENVEPTLVAWLLVQAAQALYSTMIGESANDIVRRWPRARQQQLIVHARRWHCGDPLIIMEKAARVDYVVKGRVSGQAWNELLELAMLLAGLALPVEATELLIGNGLIAGLPPG